MSVGSPRILLVDDDIDIVESLSALFEEEGFATCVASSAEEALVKLEAEPFDLLLSDIQLPGIGGIELLKLAVALPSAPTVVLATGFACVEDAVAAMRAGAFHYLTKPLQSEELLLVLRRALEQRQLKSENQELREKLGVDALLHGFIARDSQMLSLLGLARTVAPSKATVLITGDSGTGKTMLARAIHNHSDRAEAPFVELSCGSLPETLLESELFGHARGAFTGAHANKAGRFEAADGGTLFLDEIGNASPALQMKLLRVLQDRSFERLGETEARTADVRLILATNVDLERAVESGEFREDLFYRVNVMKLELPPLASRPADILPIAEHFLDKLCRSYGKPTTWMSDDVRQVLLGHDWPGNIRELENAMERALLLCGDGEIRRDHLPSSLQSGNGSGRGSSELDSEKTYCLKELLAEPERAILLQALEACDGNRARAAKMLGIHRATFFAKMKRLGIRTGRRRSA